MEPEVGRSILKGETDNLVSAFHLGYNMLLNLTRVEGINPENLIRKSFHQFQNDLEYPQLEKRLRELEREEREWKKEEKEEEIINQYFLIRSQLDSLKLSFQRFVMHPAYSIPYLQSGRIVEVEGWGLSVCVQFLKKNDSHITVDLLVHALLLPLSPPVPFSSSSSNKNNKDDKNNKNSKNSKNSKDNKNSKNSKDDKNSKDNKNSKDDKNNKNNKNSKNENKNNKKGKKKEEREKGEEDDEEDNEDGEKGEWIVISVPLEQITNLSSLRIHLPKDLKKKSSLKSVPPFPFTTPFSLKYQNIPITK